MSEEDGDFSDMVEGLTMNDIIQPPPGGAFSALTPSMWPQDILARLTQPEVLIMHISRNSNRPLIDIQQIIFIFFLIFSQKIRTISQIIDLMNSVFV